MKPFFLFFTIFDTKLVGLFRKRKQVHDILTEFQINLNSIIDEKRKLVREKAVSEQVEHEKDLLTLMIESEARGDGEGLTNEELQVQFILIIESMFMNAIYM
jgi:cytochrome P450